MKKCAFSLLFAFLLLSGFTDNQVWVKAKMPNNVYAGDRFTVEITINKLDLQNFAEYKQSLPDGFTAIEKQSGAANFSFKKQVVKFTWVRLPRVPVIVLTYDVLVNENIKGQFSIPGQFTYIYNNQRGTVQLSNDKINVYIKGERFNNNNNISNNQTVSDNFTFPPKDPGKVQCLRLRPEYSVKFNSYLVTLLVSLGNIQGKSKIEEYIPSGFTASMIDCKGALFTFDNNKVEMIWNKMPAQKNFEISYKIVPNPNNSTRLILTGRMVYISDGISYTLPIQETERSMLNKTSGNEPNKTDIYNYFNE